MYAGKGIRKRIEERIEATICLCFDSDAMLLCEGYTLSKLIRNRANNRSAKHTVLVRMRIEK